MFGLSAHTQPLQAAYTQRVVTAQEVGTSLRARAECGGSFPVLLQQMLAATCLHGN